MTKKIYLQVDDHLCNCNVENYVRKIKGVADASFNPVSGILQIELRDEGLSEDIVNNLRNKGLTVHEHG